MTALARLRIVRGDALTMQLTLPASTTADNHRRDQLIPLILVFSAIVVTHSTV